MHHFPFHERGVVNCKLIAKCNSLAVANRFICCTLSSSNGSSMKYAHIQSQRCGYCNSASIRSNDNSSNSSNNLCQTFNNGNNNNNNDVNTTINSKSECNDTNDNSTPESALKVRSSIPVYLKPSRSESRKPSFYIPRLRDEVPESYAFKVEGLGSALPLFSIFASSCEYFAMRIPLIKAGFKRVPMQSLQIKSNLVWGRSALPVLLMREKDVIKVLERSNGDHESGKKTRDQLLEWCKSNEIRNSYQVFNHFPQSHCYLGCKRGLAHELRSLVSNSVSVKSSLTLPSQKRIMGMYSFSPQTWFYPQEKEKLFAMLAAAPSSSWFIWKPARGSCGRGIQLVQGGASHAVEWTKLANEIDYRAHNLPHGKLYSSYVVQEYITNPLLLHGRKMDLRLYVAVTSFDPLIVYWHEEGLVRLAAEVYDQEESHQTSGTTCNTVDSIRNSDKDAVGECTVDRHNENEASVKHGSKVPFNVYRHLTNYSIGRRYNNTNTNTTTSSNSYSNASASFLHSESESESESESMDEANGDDKHADESKDDSNNEELRGLGHHSLSLTFNAPHSTSSLSLSSSPSSSSTQSHQEQFEESSPEGTWLKWSLEKLWSYLDHEYNEQEHKKSLNSEVSVTCDNNNITNKGSNLTSGNCDSGTAQRAIQPLLSERVKTEIGLLIVRTLMAVKPKMQRAAQHYNNKKHHNKFFEVYGFDVMLDSTLQSHLIEVNTLPSLASTSSFDYATKTNVISDALNLAMMEPFARNVEAMMEYTMNSHATSLPAPEVMKYVHCEDANSKTSPGEVFKNCSTSDKAEGSIQIYSYSNSTVRKAVLAPSTAKELQWQLQDEIDYARGFKLLYPPVNASSLPAAADDISVFADLGLLTPKDLCLLDTS